MYAFGAVELAPEVDHILSVHFLDLDDGKFFLAKHIQNAFAVQDAFPSAVFCSLFDVVGHVKEVFLLDVNDEQSTILFNVHI